MSVLVFYSKVNLSWWAIWVQITSRQDETMSTYRIDFSFSSSNRYQYSTNDLIHSVELCYQTPEEELVCFSGVRQAAWLTKTQVNSGLPPHLLTLAESLESRVEDQSERVQNAIKHARFWDTTESRPDKEKYRYEAGPLQLLRSVSQTQGLRAKMNEWHTEKTWSSPFCFSCFWLLFFWDETASDGKESTKKRKKCCHY